MKKQTQIRWATGVLLLVTVAVISETGLSGTNDGRGGNSRWEGRFKKDSPAVVTPTTTVEANPSAKVDYGTGTADCKDSFVVMSKVFDNNTSQETSRLSVPKMQHNEQQTFSCLKATPPLFNNDGFQVYEGNITVQCKNGSVYIQGSNCRAKTMAEYREELRLAEEKRKAEEAAAAEAARIAAEKAAAEAARIAEEKRKAEEAAAAAAAAAAAQLQCTGCSSTPTCTNSDYIQTSKNAGYSVSTTYYACSSGNSLMRSSRTGTTTCVKGKISCSSSSGSSK